jgi:hypothetical protein
MSMPLSSTRRFADQADGAWTTGTVQCLHQGILANSILPNQSQPFPIVWADDTDSICNLPCLLTYFDNHAINRHRTDATRSSPTTGRSAHRASNGAAAPSSLPSPSSLPLPPLFPRDAPAAAPAPTAGIFCGHSLSPKVISSTGQVLLHSLATCSTRSVFLSSATFA